MVSVLTLPTRFSPSVLRELQAAFPLAEISIAPAIDLRPLQISDLDGLCAILCGDPEMTWTRKEWRRENVAYLLDLRLNHYEKFGFGPYAVTLHHELIGMAGPQAWDYAENAIEVISYVSRKHWTKGITSKIMKWLIRKVTLDTSLNSIFAATRHENVAANSITKRFGFTKIGEKDHYGFPAIFWQLDISKGRKK